MDNVSTRDISLLVPLELLGFLPCLLYITMSFYSSEAGLRQALNATAVLFGDKTALTKLSGRCVVMSHSCSPVPGLLCSFSCG